MAIPYPAPEIKAFADQLIPLHHQHLLENRVRMVYRFSDAESKAHSRNKYGQAVKVMGLSASLTTETETDHQFDRFTFVCLKCLAWKADAEMALTGINGEDYNFCEECRDELDNAKVQDPDDHFLAWLAERKEKADSVAQGGPATSEGMWALIIYKGVWDKCGDEVRVVLVDSLLAYCGSYVSQNGDTKLIKIPADVVTHTSILERHGVDWNGYLVKAAEIIKGGPQLEMVYSEDYEASPEAVAAAAGQKEAA